MPMRGLSRHSSPEGDPHDEPTFVIEYFEGSRQRGYPVVKQPLRQAEPRGCNGLAPDRVRIGMNLALGIGLQVTRLCSHMQKITRHARNQ
jgi:hypothetical protein